MTFAVVVMIAVEICAHFESAVGKIFCDLTDISFCTADNEDVFACESIYGTAADTAADEDFNILC